MPFGRWTEQSVSDTPPKGRGRMALPKYTLLASSKYREYLKASLVALIERNDIYIYIYINTTSGLQYERNKVKLL